jgi:hypothetical protein
MIRVETEVTIKGVIELHPKLPTFPMPEGEYVPRRRTGNTTRQVNYAVEQLFKGFVVQVKDHFQEGKNTAANQELFRRILKRLDIEQDVPQLILDGKLKIDFNKLELEIF